MRLFFLLLLSVPFVGACSYFVDTQIQDLTVETPGAYNAICHVYVDDLHYKFKPPQTRKVSKSAKSIKADCLAPGNRRKEVLVSAELEDSFYLNVLNGVLPGGGWDYASDAMFHHGGLIVVDFTGELIKPELLPAQNKPDIRPPEDYRLEEFSPSSPRMNSDINRSTPELKKRETSSRDRTTLREIYREPEIRTSDSVNDEAVKGGKGDLVSVMDSISEPSSEAYGPQPTEK